MLPEFLKVLQDVIRLPGVRDGPCNFWWGSRILHEQSQRFFRREIYTPTKSTIPGEIVKLYYEERYTI